MNHLRFADDIVIISSDVSEIENMLSELSTESRVLGLKMNMKKTKLMFNEYINKRIVQIHNDVVERVEEYVYLGQLVTMQSNKSDDIKRIAAAWGTFDKYRDIMKSKVPMCLKRKVYNQCVQAALTYGQ